MDREDLSAKCFGSDYPMSPESQLYDGLWKKMAACFFPWLKRQETEQRGLTLWKIHLGTGTMVILLILLSGTSPNLSSSHFKNLQMHPPHIYALPFICKEVATKMKDLITKAYNCAVYMMTDLFWFAFILSSDPPRPWSYTCWVHLQV